MRKKRRKDEDARTDCRVLLKEDVKLAQGKRRVIKLKRGQPEWRCHERLWLGLEQLKESIVGPNLYQAMRAMQVKFVQTSDL